MVCNLTERIILKNIAFYGYHGTNAHETELGQRFFMDVEMFLNLGEAIAADDLDRTVNYKAVFEDVRKIAENKRYRLVESLGESIARTILERYPVDRAVIRIRKPSVPLEGILDYIEVEVDRSRENITG